MRSGHPPRGRPAVSKGRDPLLLGGRFVLGGLPRRSARPVALAAAASATVNLAMVAPTAPPTSADGVAEPDDAGGTTEAASR
jgi:hypothetical protein